MKKFLDIIEKIKTKDMPVDVKIRLLKYMREKNRVSSLPLVNIISLDTILTQEIEKLKQLKEEVGARSRKNQTRNY